MATYAGISALVPHIYQAVLMYAQEVFFMPQIVRTYTDMRGFQKRGFYEYASSGTVQAGVAEATDLTAQTLNPNSLGTLTPGEVGYRIDLYDRRMESDANLGIDTAASIVEEMTYKIWRQPEQDLLANFSAFTGGTVWAGSAANTAGTLNWGNLYAARAILEASKIPGPYFAVVDYYQWHYLATQANIAGLTNAAPLNIRNDIQVGYHILKLDSNFYLYVSPNLGTNTVAQRFGGVFNSQALALDLRRGLRIETQRDASLRMTEMNSTLWYAQGLVRPTFGVTIKGTVLSAPNN